MPYAPRQYPLVPIPEGPDPMSTLYGLMSLQRQAGAMRDDAAERQERQEAKRREGMIQEAARLTSGNPDAMAREVGVIDPARGLALQTGLNEERRRQEDQQAQVRSRKQQEFGEMVQRVEQHKSIYGQGAQVLSEIQANPAAYTQLRPMLIEMASQIDPRLADSFPEQYDGPTVKGLLEFAKIGEAKATKIREGLAQFLPDKDPVKGLTMLFETADTDEERELYAERAAYFEMPQAQIVAARKIAKANQDKVAKAARPAIGSHEDLDQAYANEFLRGLPAARMSATQKAAAEKWRKQRTDVPNGADAAVDPAALQAILQTPALFNRVNPEARWKLLGPLQRAGFTFPAGASELSPGELERLKVTDLRALAREARQPHPFLEGQSAMTPDEVAARRDEIEAFYVGLGGSSPNPRPFTPPQNSMSVNGRPVEISKTPAVGKVTQLKDGRWILVTTVDANGAFDGDELTVQK